MKLMKYFRLCHTHFIPVLDQSSAGMYESGNGNLDTTTVKPAMTNI